VSAQREVPKRIRVTSCNPDLDERAALVELFINWTLASDPEAQASFNRHLRECAREVVDEILGRKSAGPEQ
jgi:hypothetical protein